MNEEGMDSIMKKFSSQCQVNLIMENGDHVPCPSKASRVETSLIEEPTFYVSGEACRYVCKAR